MNFTCVCHVLCTISSTYIAACGSQERQMMIQAILTLRKDVGEL